MQDGEKEAGRRGIDRDQYQIKSLAIFKAFLNAGRKIDANSNHHYILLDVWHLLL